MGKEKIGYFGGDQGLVDVFVPMEAEFAAKFGKEVVYRRIGIKNVPCIRILGTPEFAREYAKLLDTEARAELRSKRCLITDGKGGSIRCPGTNSCKNCERKDAMDFSTNLPISLDATEDGNTIAIPDDTNVEGIVEHKILLEQLIDHLKSNPDQRPYKILSFILDGYSIQKIARELDIPWSTVKDQYNKIISLGKDLFHEK